MKYALAVPFALGAALLPLSAQAQVTLAPRADLLPTANTREISASGSYSFDGPKPYAFSLGYGLFTSPSLELGGEGTVTGASREKTLVTLGAFLDYYFRGAGENQLLPYVGAFAGYSHKDQGDGSLGVQGGAKYFFNPNVAFSGEVQYRSTRNGNGSTNLLLGLSTFFR